MKIVFCKEFGTDATWLFQLLNSYFQFQGKDSFNLENFGNSKQLRIFCSDQIACDCADTRCFKSQVSSQVPRDNHERLKIFCSPNFCGLNLFAAFLENVTVGAVSYAWKPFYDASKCVLHRMKSECEFSRCNDCEICLISAPLSRSFSSNPYRSDQRCNCTNRSDPSTPIGLSKTKNKPEPDKCHCSCEGKKSAKKKLVIKPQKYIFHQEILSLARLISRLIRGRKWMKVPLLERFEGSSSWHANPWLWVVGSKRAVP